MFGRDFLEGLDKHFGGNMVAFVDDRKTKPPECFLWNLAHRYTLKHSDHNITLLGEYGDLRNYIFNCMTTSNNNI